MKLTFLGTSAGENYPALWCRCPNCMYAREHRGRNLRQNSCTMLDDDIMLDLSNHAFQSALLFGLDMTRIRAILVTHNHKDHWYTHHMIWRTWPITGDMQPVRPPEALDMEEAFHWMGSRMTALPFLDIYGHASVYEALLENDRYHPELESSQYDVAFHALQRGETVVREDLGLRFTAVPSRHSKPGSTYNYIIERGGKTLLYALDCGSHDEDALALIGSRSYDCVVMEGTFGMMSEEYDMHQNLQKNLRMLAFLDDHKLWKGERRFILTHISPHWTPPHEQYEEILRPYGIRLAWDGMQVEF